MVFCKRNRKATELALLTAAAKLFAQKGYENTRTLEIAKEANANEALIGRYFGGKEGLLTAILKDETTSRSVLESDLSRCNLNELPKKEPGTDFRSALKDYFFHGARECEQKEEFMRIAMSRSLVDPEMSKVVKEKIIEQQLPMLAESMKPFLSSNGLDQAHIESMALLIAVCNHSINFLGRRVHSMDAGKLDLSFKILAEALELYVESKK